MYMVYWTMNEGNSQTPHAKPFATTEMVDAMRFMEDLRRRQREGGPDAHRTEIELAVFRHRLWCHAKAGLLAAARGVQ